MVEATAPAGTIDVDDLRHGATILLGGDSPYPYQLRAAQRLLSGSNVLLQAPTGAGKTNAALLPFLYARRQDLPFADRLIYAAPMRTLVAALHADAKRLPAVRDLGLNVTIQTGDQPDDPYLEGDIVFTTIDQLLSAYIGSPVSLPGRNANIVGAAAIGAYIVFDEFHLLEPDRALSTAIDLAARLGDFSRVLLMSATVTSRAAELICQRAKATFAPVRDEELAAIPSQRDKERRFHYVGEPITAQSVRNRHHKRTIAVVNTVDRAQQLYRELVALNASDGPAIHLLHSRFFPADRKATEDWALTTFARGSGEEGILIATQVIEVGLNLSAQTLHTELAPAAAVFQRAGRCARFEGEAGDVYVYALPVNDTGEPRIAPYEREEREPMLATGREIAARTEQRFTYADERAVAEATYGAHDGRLLGETDLTEFRGRVNTAMANIDRAAPRELIRNADSVSLAVHAAPTSVRARSRLDAFSLERRSFYGFGRRVLERGEPIWVLAEASIDGGPALPVWQPVSLAHDLAGALWACVSPASAHYDEEAGLELDRAGRWTSSEQPIAQRNLTYRYRRESYDEHIGRVLAHFDAQRRSCQVATTRLASALGLTVEALERLARLAAALHDVAKLAPGWQDAAWRWQTDLHRTPRAGYLAHTDQDRSDPVQRRRLEEGNYRPPSHAPEGGFAASPVLQVAVDELLPEGATHRDDIVQALFSAIARHHGAGTRTLQDFALPAAARRVAAAPVLVPSPASDDFDDHPSVADRAEFADWLTDPRTGSLGFLLYWYVSRRLRLADQRATAEASQ